LPFFFNIYNAVLNVSSSKENLTFVIKSDAQSSISSFGFFKSSAASSKISSSSDQQDASSIGVRSKSPILVMTK